MINQLTDGPDLRKILDHFSPLKVCGIELAPALSMPLWIMSYDQQFGKNSRLDWQYAISRFWLLFLLNAWHNRPKNLFSPRQADYLFLVTGNQRVAQISIPIAQALAPSSRLILTTDNQPEITPEQIEYQRLADIPVPFHRWGQELRNWWPQIIALLDYADQEFGFGKPVCRQILAILAWSIANVLRARIILECVKPRILICEHDRRPVDSIFCQVARQMVIPTVTLVHGMQGDQMASSIAWTPLLAEYVLVWGEWMKRFFQQSGVSEDRILVGGYPRLSLPTEQDQLEASALLKKQNAQTDLPLVLFLSSSLDAEKRAVMTFFEAQGCLPGARWMVRPHPREDMNWYANNAPGGLECVQNAKAWSLQHSLASADVIVGSGSTACLDALIMGKPLVLTPDNIVSYQNVPILREALERKAAIEATNATGLCRAVEDILFTGERQGNLARIGEFASDYAAYLGEEATLVSARIISQLAGLS